MLAAAKKISRKVRSSETAPPVGAASWVYSERIGVCGSAFDLSRQTPPKVAGCSAMRSSRRDGKAEVTATVVTLTSGATRVRRRMLSLTNAGITMNTR
jgi:hypothetical protein